MLRSMQHEIVKWLALTVAILTTCSDASCNTPVQFRVAALEDWHGVISDNVHSDIFVMGHDSYSNKLLANDAIPSTAGDRMMNFTVWLPPATYGVYFTVYHRTPTTGFMASMFYGDQLITQTGQSNWNTSSSGSTIAAKPNYVAQAPTWQPGVACSSAPATVNAFGQSYTDFIGRGNSSAPQPQWIAVNGSCTASAGRYLSVRMVFTVPVNPNPTCDNATHPYFNRVQQWSQWREYNVGPQNASKPLLQLRLSGQTYTIAYLANYTMNDYEAWFSGDFTADRARVADYKLTVDGTVPIVLATKSMDNYQYSDGFGILATLLYNNKIVTTTGDISGWKATNNSALVRDGWNWNATYDTTGWLDVNPYACSPQQDYGFVQPFVSDFGVCAKFIGYPDCNEQPFTPFGATYYRYVFDPATFVPLPPSVCRDTAPNNICAAGTSPAANVQVCNICPLNTYKYLAGNGSCTACPATMSTNTTGSATCSCAAGYGWNGSMCTACASNSFKTDFSNSTCTSCSTQAYSSCTSTSFTCAAGYTVSADGLSCVACAAGTYKTAPGNGQCLACSANATTASTGATSPFSCMCVPGFSGNGASCASCTTGTYKSALGNTACSQCPASISACNATSFTCDVGYTLSANGSTCSLCAAGSYKVTPGNEACSLCPANAQCSGASFMCSAGSSLAQGGSACLPCSVGTYKSSAGNGTCTACASGTTTLASGSLSAASCVCGAGLFGNGTVCAPCAVGTYKSVAGNAGCSLCPAGSTTLTNSTVTAGGCVCLPGYGWDGLACGACAANTVKLDVGNVPCAPCPTNAACTATSVLCASGATPMLNGSTCALCASGTYKDSVGNGTCTPCVSGSASSQCLAATPSVSPVGAEQVNEMPSSVTASVAGIELSSVNIAIAAAVLLAILVALAVALLRCCGRNASHKRPSVAVGESDYSRKSAGMNEFTSTSVLQTNAYSARTYTANANTTTFLFNNTEFAMPGFLQMQAGRDFRWEKSLAKGGGGEVFLGQGFSSELRKYDDGELVVKIVAPTRSAISLKASQAFDQEIAVMHYLGRHRNISHMLGWCEEPLAILMKHYKMGSLRGFIKSGYMQTKGQVMIFAKDICGALEYMHGKGVAHRDIKADNVFIDLDEEGGAVCVLGDFGIANIFSKNAHLVDGFNVVNLNGLTISYSAPEVIRRYRARDNDISMDDALRGDIFSVAILLYLLQNKKEAWAK